MEEQDLQPFHCDKAGTILRRWDMIKRNDNSSELLIGKRKQLKRNAETQDLEDVICLVFLGILLLKRFPISYQEEKTNGNILQKHIGV